MASAEVKSTSGIRKALAIALRRALLAISCTLGFSEGFSECLRKARHASNRQSKEIEPPSANARVLQTQLIAC
jgi:hypothetical protein